MYSYGRGVIEFNGLHKLVSIFLGDVQCSINGRTKYWKYCELFEYIRKFIDWISCAGFYKEIITRACCASEILLF